MKKFSLRYERGFTLIELLVVIAIIGLLSSVVLASLNSARVKGLDAQRVSNLRSVQQALELYNTTNGKYPITPGNWYSNCNSWTNATIPGLVSGGFIPSLPVDPNQVQPSTCCYLYYSSAGDGYKYMLYNCPSSPACSTSAGAKSLWDPVYNDCSVYELNSAGSF